ncbi:EF-hand domain-containing protein [Pseudoscourfieldia marina]
MGCAASTPAQQVHGAASTSTPTARKEKLWPTTVPVKPPRQNVDDGKTRAEHASESPVGRAVSLAWLAQFVKAHAGMTQSWDVVKEFMAEEDGGGKDTRFRFRSSIATSRSSRCTRRTSSSASCVRWHAKST